MSENGSTVLSDWLYQRLKPFLFRMPRQAAFDALRESVGLGHLNEAQLDAIMRRWSEDREHEIFKP